MPLTDEDIAPIAALLSTDRLAALLALTGSTRAAIELHQETLALNASLMNVVAIIEIALRNSVCEVLTAHFGVPTWLTQPPAPFQWRQTENTSVTAAVKSARRARYAKMGQAERAQLEALAYPHGRPANTPHLQRSSRRRAQIAVSEGAVIAELTFHFWKKLYSGHYEQRLWRTALKRTFPNKRLKRAEVAERLEAIYQTRNRLAHHEPVLHARFAEVVASIVWVSQNLGRSTPSADAPLAKLLAAELATVQAQAAALHARLEAYREA